MGVAIVVLSGLVSSRLLDMSVVRSLAAGPHTHWHRHEPLTHSHTHYPDAHHRHDH
jgi:hypothetical protein